MSAGTAEGVSGEKLNLLAGDALEQIEARRYDAGFDDAVMSDGCPRYGIAVSGKHVAVVCKRAD